MSADGNPHRTIALIRAMERARQAFDDVIADACAIRLGPRPELAQLRSTTAVIWCLPEGGGRE